MYEAPQRDSLYGDQTSSRRTQVRVLERASKPMVLAAQMWRAMRDEYESDYIRKVGINTSLSVSSDSTLLADP
jgi:hypothetical protein